MATPERHAANVLNAQKSTGPRTAAGKAKSASNARRHGLSARGAADLGAEDFLADLLADWPEDFGRDNFTILEALASTQARLARGLATACAHPPSFSKEKNTGLGMHSVCFFFRTLPPANFKLGAQYTLLAPVGTAHSAHGGSEMPV